MRCLIETEIDFLLSRTSMSAFSSLFDKAKIDKDLDSLFASSAGPVTKHDVKPRTVIEVPPAKEEEGKSQPTEEQEEVNEKREKRKSKKEKKNKRKTEDENANLEAEYFTQIMKEEKKTEKADETDKPEKAEESEDNDDSSSSDEDGDIKKDENEGAEEGAKDLEKKKKLKDTRAKSLDLKEEQLNSAEKTVFVGNVSNNVIPTRQTYKQFKKLFKSIGKVSSIRFRSIAFDEAVPRKVAFVKKALHSTRDTVNAYVVFAEKEASMKAASRLNATIFDHHHIRVDHVAHPAPKDNKRTIFVGNLDFEEQEERLWRYFNSKTNDDVESVRIVRDSKTNLGKGFALVQFKDSLSVDKALLLHEKPMVVEGDVKQKSRKLRILRAKAYAKPSILSPNHVDNVRKQKKVRGTLTDEQKTKLGRAKALLGKADRNTAGKLIVEGSRAAPGQKIAGIKGLKSAKGRAKKPRVTDRSARFKKDREEMAKQAKDAGAKTGKADQKKDEDKRKQPSTNRVHK